MVTLIFCDRRAPYLYVSPHKVRTVNRYDPDHAPNPDQWLVTPETARLLKHWRRNSRSESIESF